MLFRLTDKKYNKYQSVKYTWFERIREWPIILGMTHKIPIFFPNSSCPKYVLRPLFWFLGEDHVQMEEVVWSRILRTRANLWFSLVFHLRKRQKGEKIYTQETVYQQVSILTIGILS